MQIFFLGDVDTSQEGESSSHNNACHSNSDGQSPEEQLEVRLRELGAKIVYKGMDLTQTKHSKCL